ELHKSRIAQAAVGGGELRRGDELLHNALLRLPAAERVEPEGPASEVGVAPEDGEVGAGDVKPGVLELGTVEEGDGRIRARRAAIEYRGPVRGASGFRGSSEKVAVQ